MDDPEVQREKVKQLLSGRARCTTTLLNKFFNNILQVCLFLVLKISLRQIFVRDVLATYVGFSK